MVDIVKELAVDDHCRIHPTGTLFRIVAIHNKYAEIVDANTNEVYPLTPLSMLEACDE